MKISQLNRSRSLGKASLFGLASGIFLISGALSAVAGEVKYKHQLPITLSDGS